MPDTIIDLLRATPPNTNALAAENRPELTFGGLVSQAEATVANLNSRGIGRNDRVAIVLPNGPEMASAFISVGSGATTAPLNPAYKEEEFDFYLSDLKAKALLVEKGSKSPALAVANTRNIEVVEITWNDSDPAGTFTILGEGPVQTQTTSTFASLEDLALILHTSGTTSQPKIVPLTQKNICLPQ